jgi:hypothetical protein
MNSQQRVMSGHVRCNGTIGGVYISQEPFIDIQKPKGGFKQINHRLSSLPNVHNEVLWLKWPDQAQQRWSNGQAVKKSNIITHSLR